MVASKPESIVTEMRLDWKRMPCKSKVKHPTMEIQETGDVSCHVSLHDLDVAEQFRNLEEQ